MDNIRDKFKKYLEINKDIAGKRKVINDLKKGNDLLEKEIQKYMVDNDMDSISIAEGEILLYQRKIPQKFKKEQLIEKINETINNTTISEKLTDNIINNKVFTTESKIKAVVKK
jgi:hypothetical protein